MSVLSIFFFFFFFFVAQNPALTFSFSPHRWRNKEGERLADFGLDEDAEFYDEENDLPLAEIMRRRKAGL